MAVIIFYPFKALRRSKQACTMLYTTGSGGTPRFFSDLNGKTMPRAV
jgi:hypothetical protein